MEARTAKGSPPRGGDSPGNRLFSFGLAQGDGAKSSAFPRNRPGLAERGPPGFMGAQNMRGEQGQACWRPGGARSPAARSGAAWAHTNQDRPASASVAPAGKSCYSSTNPQFLPPVLERFAHPCGLGNQAWLPRLQVEGSNGGMTASPRPRALPSPSEGPFRGDAAGVVAQWARPHQDELIVC